MYFNGAFARQGVGAGAVLISPTQDKLYYAVQLYFQHGEKVSNNIAEYEGLIAGLKAAATLGVKRLTIRGDSQLLVNFSNKVYEPKDEHMEAYLTEVRKMEKQFLGLELQHVHYGTNNEADTSPEEHLSVSPRSLASSRSGSSSHQQCHRFQEQLSLGGTPAAACHRSPSLWPDLRRVPTPSAEAPGGMLDQGIQ